MSSVCVYFMPITTIYNGRLHCYPMHLSCKTSRPSGLGADGSGRERSVPARGFTSAGADKVRTLWNFTRSHHGSRERSINQLAVPPNPRLLLDCQAFPPLFVRAAGDEGDTVLRGHPAILTGFVIGRNGSPGVAPPNVLFPAFYELPLQPSS